MLGATLVASLYAGAPEPRRSGGNRLGCVVLAGRQHVSQAPGGGHNSRVGLPLAEALVACLLLAAPRRAGCRRRAAGAARRQAVLAVAGRLGEAACSCFGALHAAPVGQGLALRNFALAGGAAAVAPAAQMAPASAGFVAVAAAGCAAPVLAGWLRRTSRRPPAPGARLGQPGAAQLVVVLSPGCRPAPSARPRGPSARRDGARSCRGRHRERRRLGAQLASRGAGGTRPTRPGGPRRRMEISGTPFGVHLDTGGVVTATRPVLDSEDLSALASTAAAPVLHRSARRFWPAQPPGGRRDLRPGRANVRGVRRGRAGQADPRQRRRKPRQRVHRHLQRLRRPDRDRGVLGADGKAKAEAGGYTHAAGFDSADTIQADVCCRADRVRGSGRATARATANSTPTRPSVTSSAPAGWRASASSARRRSAASASTRSWTSASHSR